MHWFNAMSVLQSEPFSTLAPPSLHLTSKTEYDLVRTMQPHTPHSELFHIGARRLKSKSTKKHKMSLMGIFRLTFL